MITARFTLWEGENQIDPTVDDVTKMNNGKHYSTNWVGISRRTCTFAADVSSEWQTCLLPPFIVSDPFSVTVTRAVVSKPSADAAARPQ